MGVDGNTPYFMMILKSYIVNKKHIGMRKPNMELDFTPSTYGSISIQPK